MFVGDEMLRTGRLKGEGADEGLFFFFGIALPWS